MKAALGGACNRAGREFARQTAPPREGEALDGDGGHDTLPPRDRSVDVWQTAAVLTAGFLSRGALYRAVDARLTGPRVSQTC